MELAELIKELLAEMHKISTTETVVGEPLLVGETKLIPISRLRIGFGAGGVDELAAKSGDTRADLAQGGGAAGGIKVEPVAFVAVAPSGEAQLLCLDEPEANVMDRLLHLVPELADRLLERKQKSGKTAEKMADDNPAG